MWSQRLLVHAADAASSPRLRSMRNLPNLQTCGEDLPKAVDCISLPSEFQSQRCGYIPRKMAGVPCALAVKLLVYKPLVSLAFPAKLSELLPTAGA